MTNPNDNSELFEIFQNEVDLDQDQEDDDEENDQEADTNQEDERDESTDQQQQPGQKPGTDAPADKSPEPDPDSTDSAPPNSERSSNSEDRSGPENTSSPSSSKQAPPSSTVAQEEGKDPDTETGSYIKDLENEKELEGKIILSRGASVFLLILAIIAVIGAYFIGLQTGSNQQIVDNQTATTSEGTPANKDINETPTGNVQDGGGSSTNNQSGGKESSTSNDNDSGIVPGQTYYTIGLIAYKASQNNVQNYVSTVQRSLRQDANLRYVSSVENPTGNRQIWVVVGYFQDRETAKQKLAEIEDNLNQTDYRNDYTKDILEISSEQARRIAGS